MERDSGQAGTEAETPAPKGRGGIIAIGALAAGLLLGGAAGWGAIGPKLAPAPRAAADSVAHDEEHAPKKKKGSHGAPGESESLVHLIDNLVVNPAETQGTRFLVASLALEMSSTDAAAQLAQRDAAARDALIRVLGSKNVTQLSSVDLRDLLKGEMVDSLNGLLPKSSRVVRVYLPQFVIQ